MHAELATWPGAAKLWQTPSVSQGDHDLEVRSLSDEALVQQTLPLASRFGCNLAGAVLLVGLSCGLLWGLQAALAAFVATVSLAVLVQCLRSFTAGLRRARAAEREFQRRFGGVLSEQHLAEARAQLAADGGLELLGLFRGRVLPHGGLRSMRLELGTRAQPTLQVRATPPLSELQRAKSGNLEIEQREAPLTAAQVERVRALVRALSGEPVAPLASFVVDGFPCQASLLQHGGIELHASANLAGLPEQLKTHPSVRVIELFLELEGELFSHSALA